MRKTTTSVAIMLAISLVCAYLVPSTPADAQAIAEPEVLALLERLNADRLQAGVLPLVLDPALCEVARAHATEMVELGFYSHFSPVTGSPAARVRTAGIRFARMSENIAAGRTALDAYRALTLSSSHHANMMSGGFETVGLASVPAPPYGRYVVQLFVRARVQGPVLSQTGK
jgi:uncharacterized protein YkwD